MMASTFLILGVFLVLGGIGIFSSHLMMNALQGRTEVETGSSSAGPLTTVFMGAGVISVLVAAALASAQSSSSTENTLTGDWFPSILNSPWMLVLFVISIVTSLVSLTQSRKPGAIIMNAAFLTVAVGGLVWTIFRVLA